MTINVGHTPDATPGPSSLGPFSIRSIETVPIRAPLAKEYRGSYYSMTHRATLVIRLLTEQGVIGEAYVGDEDASLKQIEAIVQDEIAPRVIGRDALATEQVWAAGYPATYDILRDRRLGLVALAAVDTAVWDVAGKALGQPLWRLWGGFRDRIQMIVIGGYYGTTLDELAEEVRQYREMGLAGMKLKVGGAGIEEDTLRIETAREAAGDDWVICIDANQGYELREAIELCRRVKDLGIRWFEEPVRWHNDRRALRDVRYVGGIPTCAGQGEFSASGCRDLLESGAISVCNFDASWSGGPTVWRRVAALAGAYDVEMGHHEEPHVSVHLLASQSHGTYAECFHEDRDPFWWRLIANRPPLVDGWLQLSDAPGLGWELDWDYVNRYRLDR